MLTLSAILRATRQASSYGQFGPHRFGLGYGSRRQGKVKRQIQVELKGKRLKKKTPASA